MNEEVMVPREELTPDERAKIYADLRDKADPLIAHADQFSLFSRTMEYAEEHGLELPTPRKANGEKGPLDLQAIFLWARLTDMEANGLFDRKPAEIVPEMITQMHADLEGLLPKARGWFKRLEMELAAWNKQTFTFDKQLEYYTWEYMDQRQGHLVVWNSAVHDYVRARIDPDVIPAELKDKDVEAEPDEPEVYWVLRDGERMELSFSELNDQEIAFVEAETFVIAAGARTTAPSSCTEQ